eukprot:58463-Pleurochrysis_carterae.AAC.1
MHGLNLGIGLHIHKRDRLMAHCSTQQQRPTAFRAATAAAAALVCFSTLGMPCQDAASEY